MTRDRDRHSSLQQLPAHPACKLEDGMATSPLSQSTGQVQPKSDYGSDVEYRSPPASDYGSEFDNEEQNLIGDLLAQIPTTDELPERTIVYSSVEGENAAPPRVLLHASAPSAVVRLEQPEVDVELSPRRRAVSVEVEYEWRSRQSWSVSRGLVADEPSSAPPSIVDRSNDQLSPLQRFRTKPRKPLSVTDLVSPAWCELQYWYNLTKFGRKPQTEAMRQGSKVHKVLEEQIHEIVPVQVQTKEDRFGLKLWNTIQGLRTLRDAGLTRELEVWGIVDGQVINGIIDEVSYTCPDPEFEQVLERSKMESAGDTLPPGQPTIVQGFAGVEKKASAGLSPSEPERVVYIADVKTRGARSVPAGASLRPTWMQLMLYRKILESLSSNTVDAGIVFERYGLKPLEPFTEVFMAELGHLHNGQVTVGEEAQQLQQDASDASSGTLPFSEVKNNNNLSSLWSLMISEFGLSMHSFSDTLRAEFRYARTGEVIGNDIFAYGRVKIDEYLFDKMQWWKGAREAQGVDIEEAFKCRICEFADECTWRKGKVEEAIEKHRLRAASGYKSAV